MADVTQELMQDLGYTVLAEHYDTLYSGKDYAGEAGFIRQLLDREQAKTVLDVGCGTGSHMEVLEAFGFDCTGIDLSRDMISVAGRKVKGDLYTSDMRGFSLGLKYDAVICMYAAFNHMLTVDDAYASLRCMREHIAKGFLLIDLHNPQSDGAKVEKRDGLERVMDWSLDRQNNVETTKMRYVVEGKTVEDCRKMRIFSIEDMDEMLSRLGFRDFAAYANCSMAPADSTSKNIEVFARI